VKAREILDSRGNPTIEVDVVLEDTPWDVPGIFGDGLPSAPKLSSCGTPILNGTWAKCAPGVENVMQEIRPAILGMDAFDQQGLDRMLISLDATPNKGKLGANALLGVSLAAAKACAAELGTPLYQVSWWGRRPTTAVPMMNILNGGAHADNNVDIQEFYGDATRGSSFREGLRWARKYSIL